MSRSGYSDDCDDCEHINLYRASVDRAISGKRGQAFLLELAKEMDAMPEKTLIAGELVDAEGACCAMGVLFKSRGIESIEVGYDDPEDVGKCLGISKVLAAEIAFENDDDFRRNKGETPEQRWTRMRKWVTANIKVKV